MTSCPFDIKFSHVFFPNSIPRDGLHDTETVLLEGRAAEDLASPLEVGITSYLIATNNCCSSSDATLCVEAPKKLNLKGKFIGRTYNEFDVL
mmetsp:Transcript_9701/g.18206  ORF Transcript_9701/g.18206 Transcript_9701/m.18206 type:complete len:92 (-) Transcript_9701:7-282(-)